MSGSPKMTIFCFNGATFIQTWKHGYKYGENASPLLASMEPRSFKRGNHNDTIVTVEKRIEASMEPRSFKRGNATRSTNILPI